MYQAVLFGGLFIIFIKVGEISWPFKPLSGLVNNLFTIPLEQIYGFVPGWVPQLGVQCTAAVLGGVTTTTIINPLDCIRARLQV
jgi:hypothetical protein